MLVTSPFARQREVLQLGREPEAVEQAEEQHRRARVRLEAEEFRNPSMLSNAL
jgi:hypothetical protein